jgi:hypothetical protein
MLQVEKDKTMRLNGLKNASKREMFKLVVLINL